MTCGVLALMLSALESSVAHTRATAEAAMATDTARRCREDGTDQPQLSLTSSVPPSPAHLCSAACSSSMAMVANRTLRLMSGGVESVRVECRIVRAGACLLLVRLAVSSTTFRCMLSAHRLLAHTARVGLGRLIRVSVLCQHFDAVLRRGRSPSGGSTHSCSPYTAALLSAQRSVCRRTVGFHFCCVLGVGAGQSWLTALSAPLRPTSA